MIRLNHALPAVLAASLALGGCGGHAGTPSPDPSITGSRSHDFGLVDIGDSPASRTHTFNLTNTTGESIEVTDIKTTCGCTQAELSTRTIPAGASFDATVEIQLASSGTKTAQVRLITEPEVNSPITLTVTGQGRSLRNIRIAETVRMKPGETRSLPILASSHIPGAAPPVFAVETPAFIHAEMRPWSQMQPLDADRGTAATWRGRLEVSVDPESNAGVHTIALNSDFGELQLVAVRVR